MSSLHSIPDADDNNAGVFPNSQEHHNWNSATIRQGATLRTYLRSLDQHQLDSFLQQVLVELRARETEQLKTDVLAHSNSLLSKNGGPAPKPSMG
jgi:hypothetical protein